jgi:hypothetical protein
MNRKVPDFDVQTERFRDPETGRFVKTQRAVEQWRDTAGRTVTQRSRKLHETVTHDSAEFGNMNLYEPGSRRIQMTDHIEEAEVVEEKTAKAAEATAAKEGAGATAEGASKAAEGAEKEVKKTAEQLAKEGEEVAKLTEKYLGHGKSVRTVMQNPRVALGVALAAGTLIGSQLLASSKSTGAARS